MIESNSRPEINVVLWHEMSEEDKSHCYEIISDRPFSLTPGEFIITNKCLHKLVELVKGYLSWHKSSLELQRKISFGEDVGNIAITSVVPESGKIVLHHSVENPIQVKKQIESVLRNKCFW